MLSGRYFFTPTGAFVEKGSATTLHADCAPSGREREHDPRTRLGVAQSVVMLKRDLEVAAYVRQYKQPIIYSRVHVVDLPKLTDNVTADIELARNWKPGTLDRNAK